jgi:hypothetical protein
VTLGGQQRAAAVLAAAPAGVFGLQLGRVALVDDQAVVVVQLLARLDVAQRGDENAAVPLVGVAVGVAAVVDPARRVAAVCVDHAVFIHMEVERVVGFQGVVRVAVLRFVPADDLAGVFDQRSPAAMSCRANTPLPCTPERRVWMRRRADGGGGRFCGPWKTLLT